MPNYSRVYTRTTKQYVYWFERDSIGIALYDPLRSEKNRFTSVDAAFQITLFYHKKADHFKTLEDDTGGMGDQSELPGQFHQYLVDKAISLGYETKPDMIQMAPYFNQKFEKGIKEGKTFANRGRVSGMRSVKQSNY
tara:strand:- start:1781 stop:2191 length:411 start_codon:yes stop_codon:yes gene_type:complete